MLVAPSTDADASSREERGARRARVCHFGLWRADAQCGSEPIFLSRNCMVLISHKADQIFPSLLFCEHNDLTTVKSLPTSCYAIMYGHSPVSPFRDT